MELSQEQKFKFRLRLEQEQAAAAQSAAAAPPGPKGFVDRLAEGADLAATGVSGALVGALEPIVGVGSRIAGRDYRQDKKDFRDTFQYQPQTQGARETLKDVGEFFDPVTKPAAEAVGKGINYLDESIGRVAGKKAQEYAREFFGAGADVIGAVPAVGVAGKAAASAAATAAERSAAKAALAKVARAPDQVAKALGLRIAPESVQMATGTATKPSLKSRAAEAVAGDDVALYNQRYNKNAVNNVAVQEIGLPRGTLITDESMRVAAKPHVETYDAVRNAIPMTDVDNDFRRAVAVAGRRKESALRLPSTVGSMQEDLLVPMNGEKMIDTISDLRNKGWADFLLDGADAKAKGAAQLDLANAVEARLDRAIAANAPELAGKYQEARRGFAKIQAVEKARVGYDIDPRKLVRIAERSEALDGGLRAVADVATAFPRDFDITPRVPSTTGSWSIGSLVSPIRAGAGKAVSVSLGSQPAKLGMEGPLSYYYRGDGKSGLPERGPMTDPKNLLPGKADTAIPMGGDRPPPWPKGNPNADPPMLALPAPEGPRATTTDQNRRLFEALQARSERAAGDNSLGNTFDVVAAGAKHPGGTPFAGHPKEYTLQDSLDDYIAKPKNEGVSLDAVLIEPTKRRTGKMERGVRQRGVRQGEKVGNRTNVRAEPGARERGLALELSLQGKKVPRDKETARARSIGKSGKKKK